MDIFEEKESTVSDLKPVKRQSYLRYQYCSHRCPVSIHFCSLLINGLSCFYLIINISNL